MPEIAVRAAIPTAMPRAERAVRNLRERGPMSAVRT